MTKNKNYPSSDIKELKRYIRELKGENRKLHKENSKLRSENKTLRTGFKESIKYINEELASIPVEDIVRYFARKKKGKLSEAKKSGKTKEETRRKFQQWIKRKNKEG